MADMEEWQYCIRKIYQCCQKPHVNSAVLSIARLLLIQAPSNLMSMWSTDHLHRKRIN